MNAVYHLAKRQLLFVDTVVRFACASPFCHRQMITGGDSFLHFACNGFLSVELRCINNGIEQNRLSGRSKTLGIGSKTEVKQIPMTADGNGIDALSAETARNHFRVGRVEITAGTAHHADAAATRSNLLFSPFGMHEQHRHFFRKRFAHHFGDFKSRSGCRVHLCRHVHFERPVENRVIVLHAESIVIETKAIPVVFISETAAEIFAHMTDHDCGAVERFGQIAVALAFHAVAFPEGNGSPVENRNVIGGRHFRSVVLPFYQFHVREVLFQEFSEVRHALFDRSRKRYGIDTTGGHEHRIHVGGTADVKNAQFYFCRQSRNGQHADKNQ